jgi:hypothetical protein
MAPAGRPNGDGAIYVVKRDVNGRPRLVAYGLMESHSILRPFLHPDRDED